MKIKEFTEAFDRMAEVPSTMSLNEDYNKSLNESDDYMDPFDQLAEIEDVLGTEKTLWALANAAVESGNLADYIDYIKMYNLNYDDLNESCKLNETGEGKKDTFFITAKDDSPESVWDAVSLYLTSYDTKDDAIYALSHYNTEGHTAVVEVTTYDDNVVSDDDVKVVYSNYSFDESLVVSAGAVPESLLNKAIEACHNKKCSNYSDVYDIVDSIFSQYSRKDVKDIANYILNKY